MESPRPPGSTFVPRNRYLAIIALFAFCLCLIELTEVVELPFEAWVLGGSSSSMFSSASLTGLIRTLGYTSLFALMTLESASLPIPSEIVLPFAGYLVFLGLMNLELAIAVSTVAGLAGALIDYYIAVLLGRAFVGRFLQRFGIRPEVLQRAERWFEGKGSWIILGGRFVPLLRSIISFPAGLFRMRLSTFSIMTAVGCLGWSAVLVYAGYLAGGLWSDVIAWSSAFITTAVVVAVALTSALYLGYYAYAIRRYGIQ